MKAATITSLLLAASSVLAAPAKRDGETITITNLRAHQTETFGLVTFDIHDPAYTPNDSATGYPGQPPADTWSASHNYTVQFPDGVHSIEFLIFDLDRADNSGSVQVALNSNAADSTYSCGSDGNGGTACAFPSPIVLPVNSS
ncbi:hypothetical protein N7470_001619 [Penicillium chermesinum]|nr:hypothetical protein N7470_001619 [Penicillium chermesinum]